VDENFIECWVNQPHRVCGYRLKPYSLAHCLTLHAIDSPLVTGAGFPGAADMILALKVCSSTDPTATPLKRSWRDTWAFWRLSRPDALAAAVRQFLVYLYDFAAPPEFWESKTSDGKRVTAPWLLNRIAFLLTYSHLTYREIMEMPMGQLVWIHAAIAEVRGSDLSFITPEEKQFMTEHASVQEVPCGRN